MDRAVCGLTVSLSSLIFLSTGLLAPALFLCTFKEVNRLEHVSLGDSIILSCLQELSHLFHLLEDHGGRVLRHLHGLGPLRVQAVDQLAQNLAGTEHS